MKIKNLFLVAAFVNISAAQSAIVEMPHHQFETLRWDMPLDSVRQFLFPKLLSEITASDNPFEKKGEPRMLFSVRDTLDRNPVLIGLSFTKRESLLTAVNMAFTGNQDDDDADQQFDTVFNKNTQRWGKPLRDQKIPFVGRILLWKSGGTTIQTQLVGSSIMMIYSK